MGASIPGDAAGEIRGWARVPVLAGLTAAFLVSLAAPAQASFHLMNIREVFTGGAGGGSYVELQMVAAGQNFVGGHPVVVYAPNGSVAHTYNIAGDVANGQNQRTVLIAGLGYSGPGADFTDSSLDLPAAGGAVCFTQGSPPDCVSWGNFTGNAMLPQPGAGNPASPGGVTAGRALRRSIAPGCPTFLEEGDDTNDSATDFSEGTPNPRPNSAAVVESMCVAPNTSIDSASVPGGGRTNATAITFTFSATPSAGASFECKLDGSAFAACTSPQGYSSLDGDNGPAGTPHSFQVRASNSDGTDPSPAMHSWTVDTVPPTVAIDSKPADPSPGASASFAFHANEQVSGYQCSLAKDGAGDNFSACAPPRTYTNLADGDYTFKVRATDVATNQGAAAEYGWEVDNSLADTTPPETTIVTHPADPSESADASFAYSSNEPGSSFECRLDGSPFAACPGAGVTYPGLANGAHSFQVRAIDESSNADPTPAGFSWSISVAEPAVPPPPPALPPPPAVIPAPTPLVAAPQTFITRKPRGKTRDRTPTIRFRSNRRGARFSCKVDRGRYRSCRSPFTTKRLRYGRHVIRVRARARGAVDASPARAAFKVVGSRKGKRAAKRKRSRSRARGRSR